MKGKRLRCEIVAIVQPDGEATAWYAFETFRGTEFPEYMAPRTYVVLTAFGTEPTAEEKANPDSADEWAERVELEFSSVRGVATALLRAYYHEVPASTSRVPVEDLVEHFTHLEEFLRGAVHDPKVNDIANAMQLERERNDALRDAGKERKERTYWEARYRKAAHWAAHNARKATALRREVRILNKGLETALDALNALTLSPKFQLAYCEAKGLMPPKDEIGKYPIEACLPEYWRMAIAKSGSLRFAIAAKEEPHGHPG